jgi:Helicase
LSNIIKEQNNSFGNIIELPFTPSSVNVLIQDTLDKKKPSTMRKIQLQLLRKFSILNQIYPNTPTIDNNSTPIVIPLSLSRTAADSTKYFKFLIDHGILTDLVVEPQFPFELGFAMTIHKAQGRTLTHVILAFTQRPSSIQMQFAAIYVAMSRVKSSDNIRFLIHANHNRNESLQYIASLHVNKTVLLFYSGFTTSTDSAWDPELAVMYYTPSS